MSEREQFEVWWKTTGRALCGCSLVPDHTSPNQVFAARGFGAGFAAGFEAAHAQPAQAGQVPQWLPIETAPKDGSVVDLWHSEFGRMPGWYWGLPHHCCGEMGSYCDSDWHSLEPGWVDEFNEPHSVDSDVTHWMPLPPPPGIVGEKGGAT